MTQRIRGMGMSAKEAAVLLREEAERTAGTMDLGQRDWQAFESIAEDLIEAALQAGKVMGRETT